MVVNFASFVNFKKADKIERMKYLSAFFWMLTMWGFENGLAVEVIKQESPPSPKVAEIILHSHINHLKYALYTSQKSSQYFLELQNEENILKEKVISKKEADSLKDKVNHIYFSVEEKSGKIKSCTSFAQINVSGENFSVCDENKNAKQKTLSFIEDFEKKLNVLK